MNEPFGLRQRVAMAAAGKIGLERALQHEQAHLPEPRRFVLEERLVRQVGEGRVPSSLPGLDSETIQNGF